MSVLATADMEALELHEAISAPAGPIRPDGLVPLHIIRPGIGKGRGRHLYEAEMLEREAGRGRFQGWKMYLDHLDPAAKKRAGGMPRSIKDLAGQITEQWWDPSVPSDVAAGHGQGAVVGLAKVNRFMRALIEDLPEAVGASISATATGVRPVTRGGQQVWLVEGINPRGSVDWVTEAGAGGKVVSLIEALEESWVDDEEVFAVRETFEQKSDEEIVEILRENGLLERPGIRTALIEAGMGEGEGEGEGDGDGDDARRGKKNRKKKDKPLREGEHVDAELLTEALETDEGREAIEEAAKPVVEKLFRELVAPRLGELIEAALEDEREIMEAEARASADRSLQVRDMRDMAHARIAESRLPEPFKVELREMFDIVEGEPTAALDAVDDDPKQTDSPKTAKQKITEALDSALARKDEQFRASRPPTRVVGQGERASGTKAVQEGDEGGEDGKKKVEESSTGSSLTDHLLQESGVGVGDDLYAGILD